jgi:alpha-mannosidase
MAKQDSLRIGRITRVFGEFLRPRRQGARLPLDVAAFHVHGEPVAVEVALAADYQPFSPGQAFGPAWDTTWFRLRGTVPADWAGRTVALGFAVGGAGEVGFGAESLVWREGRPVQGLSPNHRELRLLDPAAGGESVELFVETAANVPSPWGANPWPLLMAEPEGAPLFTLQKADLHVIDQEYEVFFHDFRVAMELLFELDEGTPRRARLLAGLERACDALALPEVGDSWRAVAPAVRSLLEEPAAPGAHRVSAVGHAHMDTAWLWPLRETVRKCARTFATVLALMDRYPEYRFMVSQAQHLAWMKEHYPDLWERMKTRIAEGRLEPTGSMWVEADCNIPSGESLVRQIVHGKRFYLDELGLETEDVWLPDVFGYSAALPQIMRLGGAKWFLTQKLSWNQYNDMPHHSFYWEGIDGSRVFTHFPPADTYGGQVSAHELRYSVANFRDHEHSNRSLYLFGWGDGGGGPTDVMLESARRLADSDGLPRLTMEGARDFFTQAEAEITDPAVWVGELYLEHHRGTYTTQGATKRGNRRGELALRDAELWATLAAGDYPAAALHRAWETLLLHQFHDIIPGSGIHWVYEDTHRAHAQVLAAAEEAVDDALAALSARVPTAGLSRPVVVWNSLSHGRTDLVEVPLPEGAGAARGPDGAVRPLQDLGGGRALLAATVPPVGHAAYDLVAEAPDTEAGALRVDTGGLENAWLRVEVDDRGLLTSVWDKAADRQVLAAPGNLFQLHPDYPNFFDAWDIDAWYRQGAEDLVGLESVEVVEIGPLRAALRLVRRFGSSSVTQDLRLAAHGRWLEFDTTVEWHETNRLLKVAFPLAVHARWATYEIQYGHVERPTHENTNWEQARFEVVAHKWADVGEPGYGVALLNDCKYGHDVREGILRLTLLRSPRWPDPEADRGTHRFTYRLLPHAGDLREAGVVDAAYDLNVPLRARAVPPGGAADAAGAATASHLSVDGPNAVVEVVKRADDGSGDVVLRIYEAWGSRGPVTLTLPFEVARAQVTDLLERALGPAEAEGRVVRTTLSPFQILTLRLTPVAA